MEIIEDTLVLVTKKSNQLLSIIPDAKVIERHGDLARISVPWNATSTKILRNVGIKNVPSMMRKDYKWPGVHKPFEHQKVTAEFLVNNRRSYCLNELGCVDSETEYLSPTGWVKISEYTGGKVAQYLPETRSIEFVEPLGYLKKPCDDMLWFKTERGVDQLLSPEHRMVIHDKVSKYGKWKVQTAQDMYDRILDKVNGVARKRSSDFIGPTHACIPATYQMNWSGSGVPLTDAQLRLQIAVIADGYIRNPETGTHCIVRLKRDRKILRLRGLLAAADVTFSETTPEYSGSEGFHVFKFYAPLGVKEFDTRFWQCTQSQVDIIYDEVLHWDGSLSTGNRFARFSSNSKNTIDFVQAVFNTKGHIARVSMDSRKDKYRNGAHYTLHIRNKDAGLLHIGAHKGQKTTVSKQPSTDGFKYCFSVPSTFLLFRRNGCVFASGNTGKTSAAAWAADYLMSVGLVKRALIICPLSIMETAWVSDLFKTCMHRTVGLAYGSKEKRLAVINGDYEFVIINPDGIKIVADALDKAKFDLFIIDEVTVFKTANSDRSKTMQRLARPDAWVWGMTATPAAQSPMDAHGIARIVRPGSVPPSAGRFKDMVMIKVTQFKWVPRTNSTKMIFDLLQPAIRFTKDECLDLPEMTYTTRLIPLSPQQSKYYRMLKQSMKMDAAGSQVTASHAATAMIKLLQVSSGAVICDDGSVIEFDIKARYEELLDIIEQTHNKVLVFVPFTNAILLLKDKLKSDGIPVDVIDGSVALSKRTQIIKDFQTEDSPKVLLIQPKAASHGVTLTRADTVVWWGPVTSTETYLQANGRAHRNGQVNHVTVVHLQSSPVEEGLFKALQSNIDLHTVLVEMFKSEVLT